LQVDGKLDWRLPAFPSFKEGCRTEGVAGRFAKISTLFRYLNFKLNPNAFGLYSRRRRTIMSHTEEHIDEELQVMSEGDKPEETIHKAIRLADPITQLKLQETVIVEADSAVHDAVELMKSKRTGCLLVTEGETLVGIFTERDVARKVVCQDLDSDKSVVRDYMTSSPDTLTLNAPIAFALNMMAMGGYRHVPLIDADSKPQGFVSVRDIVNYIGEYYFKELSNLPPKPQDDAWQSVEGG
jgi:CBS domain-containing protein